MRRRRVIWQAETAATFAERHHMRYPTVVDTNGDVFLYRGKTQTLTWASDSGLDLNASGRTVRYQFGTTSLLCTVTGSVADWVISVTYLVPTTLAPGKYESELALYENAVEHEPLGLLTTTVRRNPGLENQ